MFEIRTGDCLEVLRGMADSSVDSIVTDPPYGLSFMGKKWDYDVPDVAVWAECLRVLKPGGHLLAFAGTRTQHRMAVRIEDAGFEIRDMIAWVYGSGFPKSLDVSKAIDRMDASEEQERRRLRFTAWVRSQGVTSRQIDEATGTNMGGHYTTATSQPAIMTREHLEACRHLFREVPEWVEQEADKRTVESENFKKRPLANYSSRPGMAEGWTDGTGWNGKTARGGEAITNAARHWQGWGTALKPALEPITVARKPLVGTVAENVLQHGTGALNVDECRVGVADWGRRPPRTPNAILGGGKGTNLTASEAPSDMGRWPANLIHDGSDEVVGLFPNAKGGNYPSQRGTGQATGFGAGLPTPGGQRSMGDDGSAARFFYCAKASKADRDEGCERLAVKDVHRYGAGLGEGIDPNAPARNRNHHPTVKPTDLMRYLCRLVTPPGGIVLDPFAGSGSTGKGALLEGFRFVGIERDPEYVAIAQARCAAVQPGLPLA